MIHERDRHTDTHTHTDRQADTAWRHRPRLCIASRGKNVAFFEYFVSITCRKRDPLMRGSAMHKWILFTAGETVTVLMSGDHHHARDGQQ